MREWVKILGIIIFAFALALVFYGSMFRNISTEDSQISSNSLLKLTIAGQVLERVEDDPILSYFDDNSGIDLQDILQSIRQAKTDQRIKGIILNPKAAFMGWGKLSDVRNALLNFKESGKPIYAYLEAASSREYYLASVADSIFGVSSGVLFLSGLVSQPTFYKGLLDKIGIEADFVAHGEYKNAPDVYTREKASAPQLEVINAILDQFYDHLITDLAQSRNLTKSDISNRIDRALFSLESAQQQGLIDSLMYQNDFKEFLKARFGEDYKSVSYRTYQRSAKPGFDFGSSGKMALVYGAGTIVMGGSSGNGINDMITSSGMAADIRSAAEDDEIKAIILRIDSPGGSATASDIIWKEVVAARSKKPVIVSVSDLAASGGYYIAMAADTIVAHPNSIVGSIGVFAGKFSLGKLYNEIGINSETLKRGENADFFSENSRFSEQQRAILRDYIMETYQTFISKAAQGRHKSISDIDGIARGRVWTGQQALDLGLVDVLGDFSTAVAIAKEMAGLPEDELVSLDVYPKDKGLVERIRSGNLMLFSKDWTAALKSAPWQLRSAVKAIPHFKNGEALFLAPIDFWSNALPGQANLSTFSPAQ